MRVHKHIIGVVLVIVVLLAAGRLLSQIPVAGRNYPGRMPAGMRRQQRISPEDRRKMIEGARRQADAEAMREALRVSQGQWTTLGPLLSRTEELRKQARIHVDIRDSRWITTETFGSDGPGRSFGRGGVSGGTSTGGGAERTRYLEPWSWSRPWADSNDLTVGEQACDDLLAALENEQTAEANIRQKVGALRRAREQAAKELDIAQEDLRRMVTPRQAGYLLMMGWLD